MPICEHCNHPATVTCWWETKKETLHWNLCSLHVVFQRVTLEKRGTWREAKIGDGHEC